MEAEIRSIEKRLLELIPTKVARLKLTSPAYALFLWYQDFSGMDAAVEFGIGTEALRAACLSGKYSSKLGNPADFAIWAPQQSIEGPFPGFPLPGGIIDEVAEDCDSVYQVLSEDAMEDEEAAIAPFRTMMQRVARTLNGIDWSKKLRVSEDFVVVACDYMSMWCRDDFHASLGSQKIAELIAKGMMPAELE